MPPHFAIDKVPSIHVQQLKGPGCSPATCAGMGVVDRNIIAHCSTATLRDAIILIQAGLLLLLSLTRCSIIQFCTSATTSEGAIKLLYYPGCRNPAAFPLQGSGGPVVIFQGPPAIYQSYDAVVLCAHPLTTASLPLHGSSFGLLQLFVSTFCKP